MLGIRTESASEAAQILGARHHNAALGRLRKFAMGAHERDGTRSPGSGRRQAAFNWGNGLALM